MGELIQRSPAPSWIKGNLLLREGEKRGRGLEEGREGEREGAGWKGSGPTANSRRGPRIYSYATAQ